MKLKTQETIRSILLLISIASKIATQKSDSIDNVYIINEVIKFLEENHIDLSSTLTKLYELDYMTSFRTQKLTEEYKSLRNLYNEVLNNTKKLSSDFSFNEPISIFAMYVYMLRKGYFSYDNKFVYSSDMKDFSGLLGVDVIRGKGVCRSISSMLTDIYNNKGFKSQNLTVQTDGKTISSFEELCDIELQKNDDSKLWGYIVITLTKIFPLSNHLITMVEHEHKNYLLDPTNDGFLNKGTRNKFLVTNNPNCYMINRYLTNILINAIGHYSDGCNILKKSSQINLPTISYEEYKKIYLETLKICKDNIYILEKFYHDNREIYEEIHNISFNQRDMIRRLIPIIPR